MVTADILAETLLSMTSHGDVDRAMEKFFAFISDRKLTVLLPDVLRILLIQAEGERQAGTLKLSTSHDISQDIILSIQKHVGHSGTVEHSLDRALIGGFLARTDGALFDGSIASMTRRLRRELLS